MTITIDLPWPPPAASPNARGHWSKTAKARKQLRADAYFLTRSEAIKRDALPMESRKIEVTVEFHPPDARRRDLDNCIGAAKGLMDGIADAILIDDSEWTMRYPPIGEPVKGGCVRVTIRPTTPR